MRFEEFFESDAGPTDRKYYYDSRAKNKFGNDKNFKDAFFDVIFYFVPVRYFLSEPFADFSVAKIFSQKIQKCFSDKKCGEGSGDKTKPTNIAVGDEIH